ncbi:hypothetical protein CN498_19780 [Bacillus thuringiensis]|uniref:hypothetical protein n=1 Tax=Bacillus thuringiensis TaxID=1428 RepID=UPI000BF6974E|nr:hypothetical protein [Bacillus thuringiensis]PER85852.1 hypothetical protein CN498_19780 [Bacillus thuringiensis]
MITLILIAYIIISLYLSFENMADNYYWGTEHKGMKKKEAFIWGFLTIPFGILSVVVLAGGVFLIGGSLLWIIQWIYTNMP